MTYEMYLSHHGIKGQKWGVKNGPPYPLEQHSAGKLTGAEDPKGLSSWMKKNISYAEYTTLKSPSETVKRGKGSCHDQVLLELEELRSMGYDPKATFFIEYSPKSSQGGTTHAFVTYEQNGKTYWFENAWGGQEGLHEFNNLDEIKGYITKLHKSGKTGDSSRFPNLEFSDFGDHKPGESLQELVDKSLSTEDEKKKLKHSEAGSKMPTQYVELSSVLASLDPEYLAHHGIRGQKWGVEHGPPYPLKEGVSARIKRAAKSVKDRVAANRQPSSKSQETKGRSRRQKKPTLDDKVKAMSNDELVSAADRLRKENAYLDELGKRQARKGDSFLRKSANVLNDLKTAGDAVSGFIQTAKKLSKTLGLLDDSESSFDSFDWHNWQKRKTGETEEQYSKRLSALSNIRQREAEFQKAEEKERQQKADDKKKKKS